MSNLITDWREAVQEYLAGVFTGVEVRGGFEDDINRRDADQIRVWWPGWPAMQRDISLANPTLTIRYMPKLSKQATSEQPRDESPLEQAAVDLMVAMEPKRKAGDFIDGVACYIADVTPNRAGWYVEARLQAYALNPAASAA